MLSLYKYDILKEMTATVEVFDSFEPITLPTVTSDITPYLWFSPFKAHLETLYAPNQLSVLLIRDIFVDLMDMF